MSNIFAPYVRYSNQRLPIAIGTGPIVEGYYNMLLGFSAKDALQCTEEGAIHHHSAALPFDTNGRLVVSTGDIAYRDQGIPFTAAGALAYQDASVAYADQGLSFTASGHVASVPGSIIDPGVEWFQEFAQSPGSFDTPIEDFQLNELDTCISVQLVLVSKVDMSAVASSHVPFTYRNDDSPTGQLRVLSNPGSSPNGWLSQMSEGGGGPSADITWPSHGDPAGTTVDVRLVVRPNNLPDSGGTSGFSGWYNQADYANRGSRQTFTLPLTRVVFDNTYYDLKALRLRQDCATTDADIVAWPTYE